MKQLVKSQVLLDEAERLLSERSNLPYLLQSNIPGEWMAENAVIKSQLTEQFLILRANQLRNDAVNRLGRWWISTQPITPLQLEPKTNKIALKNIKFDPDAPPIWELVSQISAQVPDEEWKKLPTDLARRFDSYQKQRER